MTTNTSYWICQCGKAVLKNERTCPFCGYHRRRVWPWIAGICSTFILLGMLTKTRDEVQKTRSIPKIQTKFVEIIENTKMTVNGASNQIARLKLLQDRDHKILETISPDGEVFGWDGKVISIATMQDKAAISICVGEARLVAGVHLELGLDTLIAPHSEVYQRILQLSSGDQVRFSGSFASSQNRAVELSYTPVGAIRNPEYLFRFTNIEKIKTTP